MVVKEDIEACKSCVYAHVHVHSHPCNICSYSSINNPYSRWERSSTTDIPMHVEFNMSRPLSFKDRCKGM